MPNKELMGAITENTDPDDYDGNNPSWCLIGQVDRNCVPRGPAPEPTQCDRVAAYFKVIPGLVWQIFWDSADRSYSDAVAHAAVILGQPATGEPQPRSTHVSQNQGA